MIGRFIFMCDADHFDVAVEAAKYLLENPDHKDAITTQMDGDGGNRVAMFAKRLKKSISVRQIHP